MSVNPMSEELEPWEEAGLAYLEWAANRWLRPQVERPCAAHAPTDLNAGTGLGPCWSMKCRHGCGHLLTYPEFFAWKAANLPEWAGDVRP